MRIESGFESSPPWSRGRREGEEGDVARKDDDKVSP
jgi:hypothetical protein